MADQPRFIDDNPHLTVTDMRATCRRLKAVDLALVVVDHPQPVSTPRKAENRQVEVASPSGRMPGTDVVMPP